MRTACKSGGCQERGGSWSRSGNEGPESCPWGLCGWELKSSPDGLDKKASLQTWVSRPREPRPAPGSNPGPPAVLRPPRGGRGGGSARTGPLHVQPGHWVGAPPCKSGHVNFAPTGLSRGGRWARQPALGPLTASPGTRGFREPAELKGGRRGWGDSAGRGDRGNGASQTERRVGVTAEGTTVTPCPPPHPPGLGWCPAPA